MIVILNSKVGIVSLTQRCCDRQIKTDPMYLRHCFSVEVISYCVSLYYRFSLSFRDVEGFVNLMRVNQNVGKCFPKPKICHANRLGRSGDSDYITPT